VGVADFDADGNKDIAVALDSSNQVDILLETGLAPSHRQQPSRWAKSSQPGHRDFDHDGRMDIASGNYASNTVSVLMNSGSRNFQAAQTFSVGNNPTIAAADLNGDSRPDIVTANYGSANVTVLLSAVQVTITSSFPGLTFVADSVTYTSPQTFTLIPLTTHTVSWPTPQFQPGTQYTFVFGMTPPLRIRAVSRFRTSTTTYTATFNLLYQ